MIPKFTVLALLRCSLVTSESGTLNTFEAVDANAPSNDGEPEDEPKPEANDDGLLS